MGSIFQDVNSMEVGIDLTKQAKGTRIEFETINTVYTAEINGDGTYNVMARSFTDDTGLLEKFKLARIPGSTWGGSALKRKWIGRNMNVEIIYIDPENFIVTSPVQKIKIIAPDKSWVYEL